MFERTELDSGIRVLSARMPGQRSVSFGAWVAAGARDEPGDLCGASHFIEHLVFKGTPSRSALAIAEAFDAVGGDLNAFTTKEFTCFHARTLSDDLDLCAETIGDLMRNATLRDEDVEAERNVVLEEIAMHEDTPDDLVYDLFHEMTWPDHGLGRRVQGTPETVGAMTADALRAYYRASYATGALVVAAAGDVDHARLVASVERSFGGAAVKTGARAPEQVPVSRPVLRIEERDIEQAHVVYGTRGISRDDPRRWALAILNGALGSGMSSRLFQEIRERRGLAYSVASGYQGFRETGLFHIYGGCSPDKVGEVLSLTRDIVADVVSSGLGDEEFTRAKRFIRGSLLLGLDEQGSLMSHLGKTELLLGAVPSPEEMAGEIDQVTPEDVRAVADDVLAGSPWSLAVVGPALGTDVSGFVGAAA